MAVTTTKTKRRTERAAEPEVQPVAQEPQARDDLDALLDEVDDVLQDAEAFVRDYVQKGGQ